MMKLLEVDGAWLAIGISVFFVVVGLVMKRVFVHVLKISAPAPDSSLTSSKLQQHD